MNPEKDKTASEETIPIGPGVRRVIKPNAETEIVEVRTPMSDGTEQVRIRVEGPFHVG